MPLAQSMHSLRNVFQMTPKSIVLEINRYHINGLHLFWDALYLYLILRIINLVRFGFVRLTVHQVFMGYIKPYNDSFRYAWL